MVFYAIFAYIVMGIITMSYYKQLMRMCESVDKQKCITGKFIVLCVLTIIAFVGLPILILYKFIDIVSELIFKFFQKG